MSIIKNCILDFIKKEKMFTSVDISNEIKQSGDWVSNREVSRELRDLFLLGTFEDYRKHEITVIRSEDGQDVVATLYLPLLSNPNDYKNTKATPITPTKFNLKNPKNPIDLNNSIDLANSIIVDDDFDAIIDISDDVSDDSSGNTSNIYMKFNFPK